MSTAPIARLTIDETWYDKGGDVSAAAKGRDQRPAAAGRGRRPSTFETPFNAKMTPSNYNSRHANGTVKPTAVKSLDAPKEPATKPAAAKKKKRGS